MNQIAKPSKIDPTRIDPRHYFESLVQRAAECGLLAEHEIHRPFARAVRGKGSQPHRSAQKPRRCCLIRSCLPSARG